MPFKRLKKPLTQLLRSPPPAPPSPEERITALDAQSPEQLLATALSAADDTLRAAAVGKLHDGAILRALAGLSPAGPGERPAPGASLQRLAQARVAQLIDAGAVDQTAL